MSGALADIAGFLGMFLLANILAGLVRVVRGPAPVDRMLAAQLLTTMGIAAALLFGMATDADGLLDVALVLAVLAALVAVTFARRFQSAPEDENPEEDGDD